MAKQPLSPDFIAARKNLLPGLLFFGGMFALLITATVMEEQADAKRRESEGWRGSTRTVHTLQIDERTGDVIRSEKETLYGIENKRGEFYPRPD